MYYIKNSNLLFEYLDHLIVNNLCNDFQLAIEQGAQMKAVSINWIDSQ